MATAELLNATQYRLAQHYLKKLNDASAAVRHGHASLIYGLRLFDQEWPQIQYWQTQATRYRTINRDWSRLCITFPLVGTTILAFRQTREERLRWWQTALEVVEALDDSEARLKILPSIVMSYFNRGDFDKAERYCQELLELGTSRNDLPHVRQAHNLLGTILLDRGKLTEAEAHFQRALKMSETTQQEAPNGGVLKGLGAIAMHLGKFEDAYQYFSRYLALSDAIEKVIDYCLALHAVSEALKSLRRYEEAEPYLQQGIALCRKMDYRWGLGQMLIALGSFLMDRNDLEAAQRHLEEGIGIARNHSGTRDVIFGLATLGYVRFRLGNSAGALTVLLEALAMARAIPIPEFVAYTQRNLAFVYAGAGDVEQGRSALYEALTVTYKVGMMDEVAKMLPCAVILAHQQGLDEQAARWAGYLMSNPDLDQPLFESSCQDVASALGEERYHQSLEQGKALTLDEVVQEVMALMPSV